MRPAVTALLLAATLGAAGLAGAPSSAPQAAAPAPLTVANAGLVQPPSSGAGVDVLVTLDDRVSDVAVAARAATPAGGRVTRTFSSALTGFAARVPEAALPALQRAPGVVRVERDGRFTASTVQPSPPRGLDRVDQRALPLSGSYGFQRTGTGVTAYVVDSGIRRSHSDFGGRAVAGFDAVTQGGTAEDCDGHGTHVAGTVGGARSGIAKGVRLSAVRVLGCDGSGSGAALLAGLDFIVRDHQAGRPATAVLSLGGPGSATVDDAVSRVVADGVTVAVAAGNEDADACLTSPARVPAVLTVGASDPGTDRRAVFSNKGACVDLFAPGVGIVSAGIASDTSTLVSSGTSMAAPHVAGAAALVLQATPTASPATVGSALAAAATRDVVTDAQSRVDDLLHTDPLAPLPATTASPTSPPASQDDLRGRLTPLTPSRLLDTRQAGGPLEPDQPRVLQVAGRGGVPPTGVTAVALNVTVTGADATGYLTVHSGPLPESSNLNHLRGQTVANLVATAVDGDGRVSLTSSGGRPDVVVDVVGYYSDVLGGSRSTGLVPARLLDTRSGLGGTLGRLPSGRPVTLDVTGRGGVPATGVSAVVVNVTALDAQTPGYLTAFPGGEPLPDASTLNYASAAPVPNLAVVAVGPDGTVQLQASAGGPNVLVDVVAWYGGDGQSRFVPVTPDRLLDTRQTGGRFAAGETRVLRVGGAGPVPSLGLTAVVVNVTVVGAEGKGFLTVYPADADRPGSSNLNHVAGQTVPNLVLSATTVEQGELALYSSAGTPHVLVDVVGYTTATTG